MGIWDDLRSVAVKFINRTSDSSGISHNRTLAAVEFMPDPDRRETITRILTGLGKFAVDSAVTESLKSVSGGCPIEAANLKKKPRHKLLMEEMQARMEKMEENLNSIRLDDEESILCAKDLDPRKEESTEPSEKHVPLKTDVKKVFIRSRL